METNFQNSIQSLLKISKLKVSKKYISDSLKSDPDFPSFKTVSNILYLLGINHSTFHVENDKLSEINTPFISFLKEENYFKSITIKKIQNNTVYLAGKKAGQISLDEFIRKWNSIIIVPEKRFISKKYNSIQKKRNIEDSFKNIKFLLFTVLVGLVSFISFNQLTEYNNQSILFFSLKVLGSALSLFAIRIKLKGSSKLLNKVCSLSKSNSCSEMLINSKDKIFNIFSFTTLAATYFIGSLLVAIILTYFLGEIKGIGFFSLLSSPVIIYSLYLQIFKYRKVCPVCMLIVVIIAIEVMIVLNTQVLINEIIFFELLIFALVFYIIDYFLELDDKEKVLQNLNKLVSLFKYNDSIYKFLIWNEDKLEKFKTKDEFIIGPKKSDTVITIVTSLQCSICVAEMHKVLAVIKYYDDLQFRFVFACDPNNKSLVKKTKYILRHRNKETEEKIKVIENIYYNQLADSEINNGNDNTAVMDSILDDYQKWIMLNKIHTVPSIFINEKKMPLGYSISDLIYCNY